MKIYLMDQPANHEEADILLEKVAPLMVDYMVDSGLLKQYPNAMPPFDILIDLLPDRAVSIVVLEDDQGVAQGYIMASNIIDIQTGMKNCQIHEPYIRQEFNSKKNAGTMLKVLMDETYGSGQAYVSVLARPGSTLHDTVNSIGARKALEVYTMRPV